MYKKHGATQDGVGIVYPFEVDGRDPSDAEVPAARVVPRSDGDYVQSLDILRTHHPDAHAWIIRRCYLLGDMECQRAYADSLIAVHGTQLAALERSPIPLWPRSWAFQYGELAFAHAMRGNKDEAVAWEKRARRVLPRSVDAYIADYPLATLAQIYVVLGDHTAAVAALDTLLAGPAGLSVRHVEMHPMYDRLRSHPGFQALLEKHGN